MLPRKLWLGLSIRGHGYYPAAWRHPDVPADGTLHKGNRRTVHSEAEAEAVVAGWANNGPPSASTRSTAGPHIRFRDADRVG